MNFFLIGSILTFAVSHRPVCAQQIDDLDDPLGLGIVTFTFTLGESFDLYELNEDGTVAEYPFTTVTIGEGETGSAYPYCSGDLDWEMFAKYEEWEIYQVVCFEVMESRGLYVIAFGGGKKCCIGQDVGKFFDWDSFLKVIPTDIYRLDAASNPLRKSPDDGGENIETKIKKEYFSLQVQAMQGDWIEVNVYDGECDGTKLLTRGWIKWRDANGLLIDFSYIC